MSPQACWQRFALLVFDSCAGVQPGQLKLVGRLYVHMMAMQRLTSRCTLELHCLKHRLQA